MRRASDTAIAPQGEEDGTLALWIGDLNLKVVDDLSTQPAGLRKHIQPSSENQPEGLFIVNKRKEESSVP